jgi:hypothetical protein
MVQLLDLLTSIHGIIFLIKTKQNRYFGFREGISQDIFTFSFFSIFITFSLRSASGDKN